MSPNSHAAPRDQLGLHTDAAGLVEYDFIDPADLRPHRLPTSSSHPLALAAPARINSAGVCIISNAVRSEDCRLARGAHHPRQLPTGVSASGDSACTALLEGLLPIMAAVRGIPGIIQSGKTGTLGCYDFSIHTGALARAEIGLMQSATVEPVRVMPAKEVGNH